MQHIVLSILIITHNQKELLKRCLKSVLEQKLNVPYEIIVSDDRSTDGTKEWIDSLQNERIRYTYCNSDECDPVNMSERCGWNKLNAWSHARGKYMVNIDADDYLKSNDIYQLQIDALESHPECSMCLQQVWQVKEGADLSTGECWPKNQKLFEGAIITAEDTIIGNLRGLNPCYMMRRREEDDMKTLYGKHYDDTVITLHHLQFNPVIFVNRADYVWVQYKKSISHSLSKNEMTVLYGMLPINHSFYIPKFTGLFIYGGLYGLIHMLKTTPKRLRMSKSSIEYLKEFDGFLFRYYTEQQHSPCNQIRYKLCRLSSLLCKKFNLLGPRALKFLFILMVNRKSAYAIKKEYWKVNLYV